MGKQKQHPIHPVKWILVQRGIEQRDLAVAIGYDAPHVNKIVNGRYPACAKFRAAVASALDLDESVLFDPALSS